jgi:hypothetical protein
VGVRACLCAAWRARVLRIRTRVCVCLRVCVCVCARARVRALLLPRANRFAALPANAALGKGAEDCRLRRVLHFSCTQPRVRVDDFTRTFAQYGIKTDVRLLLVYDDADGSGGDDDDAADDDRGTGTDGTATK